LISPHVIVSGTGWLGGWTSAGGGGSAGVGGWAAHRLAMLQTNAASQAANAIAFIEPPLRRGTGLAAVRRIPKITANA